LVLHLVLMILVDRLVYLFFEHCTIPRKETVSEWIDAFFLFIYFTCSIIGEYWIRSFSFVFFFEKHVEKFEPICQFISIIVWDSLILLL
jgi:hypothetical protein